MYSRKFDELVDKIQAGKLAKGDLDDFVKSLPEGESLLPFRLERKADGTGELVLEIQGPDFRITRGVEVKNWIEEKTPSADQD